MSRALDGIAGYAFEHALMGGGVHVQPVNNGRYAPGLCLSLGIWPAVAAAKMEAGFSPPVLMPRLMPASLEEPALRDYCYACLPSLACSSSDEQAALTGSVAG